MKTTLLPTYDLAECLYLTYKLRTVISLGGLNSYYLNNEVDILNRGVTELRGGVNYKWAEDVDIFASFEEYKI